MSVDHINRNRLDNRRENLRVVSQADNNRNRGVTRRSSTGYPGVFVRENGNFRVTFKHHGIRHAGGTFGELSAAIEAARDLRSKVLADCGSSFCAVLHGDRVLS
ncbi:MAG: HNH endonuclease [Mycobacteriaceae bacterium]